jgi:hypothetical protein
MKLKNMTKYDKKAQNIKNVVKRDKGKPKWGSD